MSKGFNLTAQLNLVGPTNVKQIAAQIKKDLGNVNATVNFKLDPAATKNVTALTSALQKLNSTLSATNKSASSAASAIRMLGQSVNSVKLNNIPQQVNNISKSVSNLNNNATKAKSSFAGVTNEMEDFGKQAGLAVRRFTAFATVTSVIYGLTNSINKGVQAFIEYDKELVRLQQVTGQSLKGLTQLQSRITDLSTSLGVSSKELTTVAVTLAQAGLNAKDTERSLKALALSSLAPSFDSMNETVEGSIALMRQFGIGAGELESALGSVNTVAAKFAVEASDIITAIQRTGGVFATASKGVSSGTDALNEFIAVFTSVRATTRESAETIATGLRTIFTRVQRGDTINALKEFGVNLTDAQGKFVGAYKAVQLLSEGLNSIDPRDLKFSRIVEELGGFRQIGKVIPLIQQFSVAQDALATAQQGQSSLARDAVKAQLSLANQISKVREQFFALFRELGQSQGFQTLVKGALSLSGALIKVADASRTLLPALSVMLAFKGARALTQFAGGFNKGFRGGPDNKKGSGRSEPFADGGPVRKFARGGVVPGSGNRDTVPAMLMPGEFVIRKKAVETIGANHLHDMNKYGSGGSIRAGKSNKRQKFANGGRTPKPQNVIVNEINDGDSLRVNFTPESESYQTSSRLVGVDTYESNSGPKWMKNLGKQAKAETAAYYKKNQTVTQDFIEGYKATGGKKDSRGRPFFKNDSLKSSLIDKGLGYAYMGGKKQQDISKKEYLLKFPDNKNIVNKKNLGGKIQKFAGGGKVLRNIGIIDTDILRDAANATVVRPAMEKLGITDVSDYTTRLGELAVKARKNKSLSKFVAIAGAAGSGKSSIATGKGANDNASLRKTTRSQILTPEDIDKVNEVIVLTSTASQTKLDSYLKDVDRAYILSSNSREEQEQIRLNRDKRDLTGVGLYGRKPGTTRGAITDFALEETILRDELGKKATVLGRKKDSFGLRRKKDSELPEIIQAGGFYTGGFAPPTRGHRGAIDTLLDNMLSKNPKASLEDIVVSVAPDLPMIAGKEGIEHAARYGIFPADFRALLSKINFGNAMISTQDQPPGSLPKFMEVAGDGDRRRFARLKGAMAVTSGKEEGVLGKYARAGMDVKDIPRIEDISATKVRTALFSGDDKTLTSFVDPEVASILMGNRAQLRNRSTMVPMLIEEIQKFVDEDKARANAEISKLLASAPGGPYGNVNAKLKQNAPEVVGQIQEIRNQRDRVSKGAFGYRASNIIRALSAKYPDIYGLDPSRKASVSAQPSDVSKEIIAAQLSEQMRGEFGGVPAATSSALEEALLEKVKKATKVDKSSGMLPAKASEILSRLGGERIPSDSVFGDFAGKKVSDTAKGGKLPYWISKTDHLMMSAAKEKSYTSTRDYLINKFNESQGTKKATTLENMASAVLQSTQLGLVGLNPLGHTNLIGPLRWDLGQDASGRNVSIDASIIERGLPTQYQNVIDYLSGQTEEIVGGASKLLGINPKKLTKKQRETLGQGNIEGALLEQIFGSADATILDDALRTRPIDFPGGIGSKAGGIFGIDGNMPTEVKRTIDSGSRGKAIKEFQRYFRQQYGIPEPVEEELQKFASGGQVNNIENRKYIGAGKYLSEDQVRYLERLEKDRDKNIEERNKLSDALNDRLGGVYGGIIKNRKDSKSTNTGLDLDSNQLFGSQSSKEKELAVNDWYTGISKIGDRDFNRNLEQEMYNREKQFIELDAKVDPIAKQKEINEFKKLKLEAEKIEAEMFAIRKKAYSSKPTNRKKFASGGKAGALSGPANGELLKKYGEIFPSSNSTGPFKEMVFDFDDTLVTGGEIRLPDGRLDLSRKDDMPLVQEMLKKGKLTPLGQHLSEALKQEPSLIDGISILSARNPNQAGILAQTLQNLGLPIPASKIRGSNGPQNKKITGYQKMIDDNLETITRLKGQGHEAIHYKFAKGGKVEEEYKSILASILPKEMLTSDGYLKMPSGEAEPIEFIPERSLAEKSRSRMMSILLGKAETTPPEEQTGAFYDGGLRPKVLRHNLEKYKDKLPEDEYKALKKFVDHRILFEGNEDLIKTAGGLHRGVLAHETFHDIQGHLYDNHPEIMDKLHESLLKRKDAVEKWYKDPKNAEWAGPKDYKLEHFFPTATSKSPYSGDLIAEAYSNVQKQLKKQPDDKIFRILGESQWDLGKNELVPVLLSAAVENNKGAIELLSQAFGESGLNPDFYKTIPQKRKLGGVIRDIWHGTTTGKDDSVLESFKKYGAKSDVSSGFGQGQGFYVYSDPTSAMVRAMELEGGANYLTAADPNGKPMALKFTELLDGKNWDLDYEFQNADIVNFIHSHYDRVKEAVAKSKGVDLGTNLKDFSLDKKYDEYLDTTDNTVMRKVGISFKDQGKDAERLLANNNYGDARSGEVLSSLVKSIMHSDPDFYEEFENSFFHNLKPKQGLKYVGKDPLKPVLAQIFTRQKNVDDTGWITEKFAKGGSPKDTVPALLTPGEFVVNKDAAQKIGYGNLHKLNKADKIQGYNKGGIVGTFQKLAGGGFADPNSFIRRFGDWFTEQPKNNQIKRFDRRPDIVGRSSTQVNKEVPKVLEDLIESINKLGFSAAQSASVIKKLRNSSEVSYKEVEKALSSDLDKLKAAGAGFDTIVRAEETLYQIRQQGKRDVDLKKNLEGAFAQRGNLSTKFMGGKMMMGDINQGSASAQEMIDKEAQYLISSRSKKLRAQGKDFDPAQIADKAYRIAASKVSGVSQKSFSDYGISGRDIKQYIDESKKDRKTLLDLDKEYAAQKMAELKRSSQFASVGSKQQQRMIKELEKETRREISIRRSLINDLASRTGQKGVGAIDMMDFNNSPILKYMKSLSAPQVLSGAAIGTGLIAGQGKNIGRILYGQQTDEAKVKAAETAAAIESSGTIISTGLATAAEVLAASPNKAGAIAAAVIAIGSALYATAEYVSDISGSQAEARKQQQSENRAVKLDVALEKLNRASKEYETDAGNANLSAAVSDALKDINDISVSNAQFDLQEAKLEFQKQSAIGGMEPSKATGLQYLTESLGQQIASIMPTWTGLGASRATIGAPELARINAEIASKNKDQGNVAQDLIRTALNQGANREQIISGTEYKDAREAMLMADPKGVAAFNAAVTASSNALGGRALSETELKDVLEEVTKSYYEQGNVILDAIIKASDLAKAMEAADRAGRQLAVSFDRMVDSINQSINRIQYESQQRAKYARSRIKGLTGESGPPEINIPELNVLDNPQAYTPEDFALAIGKAADLIGGKEGKNIENMALLGKSLPDIMTKAIADRLGGEASLTKEDAAKKAISTGQDIINSSGLDNETKQKLNSQLIAYINNAAEKISDQGLASDRKAALEIFLDQIRTASSAIGDGLTRKVIDAGKAILEFRQNALNDFAKSLQESSEYMRQSAELRRKADKIMYKANIDTREIFRDVGESYNEAKAQTLNEVGQMTGGITNPAAIGQAIRDENKIMQDLIGKRDDALLNKDFDQVTQFTQDIQNSSDKIKNYNDALDKLANSTNMYERALQEAKNVAEIQKDRQSFVEKLLTNTPEEADNLNQAFIRLQRNLSGGLNNPWNQRDARKAFNEALFKTGSLREAYRAGNTVLANQRKETLGLMQDPGFRAIIKGQIQNQRVTSGQGLLSEADLDNMFRQQEGKLMQQMAIESGFANNPVVMQAIQTKMNPESEPMAQAAANQILEAAGLQKAATEEQAKLREVQAMELNVFAMDNLTVAIIDLKNQLAASFGRNDVVEGRDEGRDTAGQKMVPLNLGTTDLGDQYRNQAAVTASRGGLIYAAEGQMIDFKPRGTDTIPAMLSPGEFVINAKSTAQNLPLLEAINNGYANGGKVKYFKDGGLASLFRGFDKDKNNLLSENEFFEYFSDFDLNKDKAIDMNEFLEYGQKIQSRAKLTRLLNKPGTFHSKRYKQLQNKADKRTPKEENEYATYSDIKSSVGPNRALKQEQYRQNRQNDRMWNLNLKGKKNRSKEEETEYQTLRENWKTLNPEKAAAAQARTESSRMWTLNLKGKKRSEEEQIEYTNLRQKWAKNNPKKAAAAQDRIENSRRQYLWSKGSKGRSPQEEAEYIELRKKWAEKDPEQAKRAENFNDNSRRLYLANKGSKNRTEEEEKEFNNLKDKKLKQNDDQQKEKTTDLDAAKKAELQDANDRVSGFINKFILSMGPIGDPSDYVKRWTLVATALGRPIMAQWVRDNPGSFRLNKHGQMSWHDYNQGGNEYNYGPGFKSAVREGFNNAIASGAGDAPMAQTSGGATSMASASAAESGFVSPSDPAYQEQIKDYLNKVIPKSPSWPEILANESMMGQTDQQANQPRYFDIAQRNGRPVIKSKDDFYGFTPLQKAEASAEYLDLQKKYGYQTNENGVIYNNISEEGHSSRIPLSYEGATSAREHINDLILAQASRVDQSQMSPAQKSVLSKLQQESDNRSQDLSAVRAGQSRSRRWSLVFEGKEVSAYKDMQEQAVTDNLSQEYAASAVQTKQDKLGDMAMEQLSAKPTPAGTYTLFGGKSGTMVLNSNLPSPKPPATKPVGVTSDRMKASAEESKRRKDALSLREKTIREYFGDDDEGKRRANKVIGDLSLWDKTTAGRPADYDTKFDADIIQMGLFRGKSLVNWDRPDMISPDEAIYRYEAQVKRREDYMKGRAAGDLDKFDPSESPTTKGIGDWLSGKNTGMPGKRGISKPLTEPIKRDTTSVNYKPPGSVKLDPITFKPVNYDENKLAEEIKDLETDLSWSKRDVAMAKDKPVDYLQGLIDKKRATIDLISKTREEQLGDRVKLNESTEKRYQELVKASDRGLSATDQKEYIRLSLQRGKPYSGIRALPGDISSVEDSMRRDVFSETELKRWNARQQQEFETSLSKEKETTFYDKVASELADIARKNVDSTVSKLTGSDQLGQISGSVAGFATNIGTGIANPSTVAVGVGTAGFGPMGAIGLQSAAGTTAAGLQYRAGQNEAAIQTLKDTATTAALNLGLRALTSPKTWEVLDQAKKEFADGIANPPTLKEFLNDPEMIELGKAVGYTDLLESARTGQAVDTTSMFPHAESAVKGLGKAIEKIPQGGAIRGTEFGTGGGNAATLNARAAKALQPEMLDLKPGITSYSSPQTLTPKGEAAVASRIQTLAKSTPVKIDPKLGPRGYFSADAPGSITGKTILKSPVDEFAKLHEESHAISRILGILDQDQLLTKGVVSKLPKNLRPLAENSGPRISAMDEYSKARMSARGTNTEVPKDLAVTNALARTQEEGLVAQSLRQKPLENPSYVKELGKYNSLLNQDPATPLPSAPEPKSSTTSLIKTGAALAGGTQLISSGIQAATAPPKKPQKKAKGGMIYASGGQLAIAEPSGTDTVPAMLTPGEFVVNAKSTKQNLGLLRSINRSKGGPVNYLANGGIPTVQTMELRNDTAVPSGPIYQTADLRSDRDTALTSAGSTVLAAASPYSDSSILPSAGFLSQDQLNAGQQALNQASNTAALSESTNAIASRMEYDKGVATANADMANMDLRTTGEMLSADAAAIGLGAAEGGVQLGAGAGVAYGTGLGLAALAPFTGGVSLAVAPVVVPAVGALAGMGAKYLTNKAYEATGTKGYTDSIKEASPLGYNIGSALPAVGAVGSQIASKGVQAFAGSAADRAFGATTGALSDAAVQAATQGGVTDWKSVAMSATTGAIMPGKDVYEGNQPARRFVGGTISKAGELTGSQTLLNAGGEMRFSPGDRALAAAAFAEDVKPGNLYHAGVGGDTGWIPEGNHASPVLPRPSRGALGATSAISPEDLAANPRLSAMAETAGDPMRMGESVLGHIGEGAYFGAVGSKSQEEAASLAAQAVDYAHQATLKGSGTPMVLAVKPTDKGFVRKGINNNMHEFNPTLSTSIGDSLGVDSGSINPIPHSNRVSQTTPADVLTEGVLKQKQKIAEIRATQGDAAALGAEIALSPTVASSLPPAVSSPAYRTLGVPETQASHWDINVPNPSAALGGSRSTTRGINLYKSSERHSVHGFGQTAGHVGKHELPHLFGGHEEAGHHSSGGLIYANNGALVGASGTDSVPAMLTPGEFVINREASQKHMPLLNAINSGHFNRGGIVNYLANGGVVAPKYYAEGGQQLSYAAKAAPGVSNTSSGIGDMQAVLDKVMQSMSSSFEERVSQLDQLNQNMTGFIESFGSKSESLVAGLSSSTENLGSYATSISSVSLPETITFNGNVTSEHRFNGAEAANRVIETMGPAMEQQTNDQLNSAFSNMNRGAGQLDSGVLGPDTTSIMGQRNT